MEKIRIKMLKTVQPDILLGFCLGTNGSHDILREGKVYDAVANRFGAITGICSNGTKIGAKPGEFEFVEAPYWIRKIHDSLAGNEQR